MKVLFLLLIFQYCYLLNTLKSQELASYVTVTKDPIAGLAEREDIYFNDPLIVHKCVDFAVTGKGNNAEWNKTGWNSLTKLDSGGRNYESRFKVLYSGAGIYVLFSGEDDKITTKDYNDFEAIYNGDVFEVFFHPSPQTPVYFEYEINQLRKELILMLSRSKTQAYPWAPKYPTAEERKPIKRMVDVVGEKTEVGASIKSWTAEVFFPYTILGLLPGVPPLSGMTWNANFCRLDYDSGKMIKYSYSPAIQTSFHELDKFLAIKFE